MTEQTMHFRDRTRSLLGLGLIILSGISLSSCVSFDTEIEGEVEERIQFQGLSVYSELASEALLAIVIRNDNAFETRVALRPIGGEIGYDYGSGRSFSTVSSGSRIRGSFFSSPSEVLIAPGEEALMTVYLRNWYLANKDFKTRIEISAYIGEYRHGLILNTDETDYFSDPSRTFRLNTLGENNPNMYGGRGYGVGELPRNYELTVPE